MTRNEKFILYVAIFALRSSLQAKRLDPVLRQLADDLGFQWCYDLTNITNFLKDVK